LQDAKDQRSEERRWDRRHNANQMSQEEADALDAAQASSGEARAAADEADAAELDQEREDAAYAKSLADEEANREAGTGQYLPTNILLQPNDLNSTSNSSTPTPVEVDEFSDNISLVDHVARANAFLQKGNIDRRIISASTIFSQQVVINFTAADIVALRLSDGQKHMALKKMMSGSLVATAKPAHSSNVNIMTTKSPPSFTGVITKSELIYQLYSFWI
jgi:regulator of protease activity HflC (stomatin/prohibitin superfamily)